MFWRRRYILVYLTGWLIKSMYQSDRMLPRNLLLEFLIFMVLKALRLTVLSSFVSISIMRSYNSISTSMSLRWSKKSIQKRRSIGVTLNLLITKMSWISLRRILEGSLHCLMMHGPSSHTGGSISHTEHGNKLTSSLGRVPMPHKLFIFTHTKKHDGQTFIDERYKSFNDKVVRLREASQANNGSGDDAPRPIDEVALYYEAAGGEKKRRVYGLGSQSSCYYCSGDKDGNNRSINSFEFHNQDEISNELTSLRKTVQTQGSMITKLTRMIQALCNRIGISFPNESENAHNSQQDEHDEGTGGGDDNNDHGLS